MNQFSPDLIRFSSHLGGIYSLGVLCFFGLLIAASIFCHKRKDSHLENLLFWGMACLLIAFTALRPMGIARDDIPGYVGWALETCSLLKAYLSPELCYFPSRDWGWHFLIRLLKSFMPGESAILSVSAFGTFIQLLIIHKLCRQKLLALTLFIPLTYLYYDFTFLRASLAITSFFVGFYLLVQSQKILGSGILLGGYLFHSQGIFSIGIIPFRQVAKYRYIFIAAIFILITCIYLQWTLPFDRLSFLSKNESAAYWQQYQSGLFIDERAFPLAHLLIIGFVTTIVILNKSSLLIDNLTEQYALGSILLAVFLAWFFAPIHAMQTRLFDFYLAPLVFIVGNLRLTKITLAATLGLAILLYIRMELLHNWIIG